jgi:uncharacterized protein with NRDE domain
MCTLVLGLALDRRWPVIVAANRDELLARPAEGWGLRDPVGAGLRAATPLDLEAGGTWIGLSSRGVFAGLTNFHLRPGEAPDRSRRSRGELVPLALSHAGAAQAAEAVRTLDASRWNPFHLVVADGRGGFLWWYDGEEQGLSRLEPGLHVVTERDREGRGVRGDRLRARWPADPTLPLLRGLLTDHGDGPARRGAAAVAGADAATCLHGDPVYGTRSSAVLRLAPELAASDLWVAEGRPCVTPHLDRADLLLALSRA